MPLLPSCQRQFSLPLFKFSNVINLIIFAVQDIGILELSPAMPRSSLFNLFSYYLLCQQATLLADLQLTAPI